MYKVHPFVSTNEAEIRFFMEAHPFALVVAQGGTWPVATQLPVLLAERNGRLLLRGHFMKNTDHHAALTQNPHALFVFTGAHSYVSASWYSRQQQASTWNYSAVHARTVLRFLDDQGLYEVLRDTTAFFEKDAASPAAFNRLSPEYVQKLMPAVIGFEAEVASLDATFKWSQNRDADSFANIVRELEKGDANAKGVAADMRRVAPKGTHFTKEQTTE